MRQAAQQIAQTLRLRAASDENETWSSGTLQGYTLAAAAPSMAYMASDVLTR